jgi:quercetin dioxygenase-like cupin family protein
LLLEKPPHFSRHHELRKGIMCQEKALCFVTSDEMSVEVLPWGPHEWLCRPELTAAEQLMLVRVRMPPGKAHAFHRHPAMEEIIYVISGRAEQWVGHNSRLLGTGEIAHIPRNVVHGTYNTSDDTLVFLAILSPAKFEGPWLVDVSQEEPWRSIRQRAPGSGPSS